MEKEISSGAMLGIVLIALAAIIALGFGVFAIAKGIANDGTVQVQDKLGKVSLSTFDDYDQKVVTGTQVMSAYSNFTGKPYAVLIASQAFIDNGADDSVDLPDTQPITIATGMSGIQSDGGSISDIGYINYNAQLSAGVTLKNGFLVHEGQFKTDNGNIAFNNVTANLSQSGQIEYIPTSGRFQANVIKDASGTIIGVAFKQVAGN